MALEREGSFSVWPRDEGIIAADRPYRMIGRREFITLIGAAAAWPLAARAQQAGGRIYRIGILGATSLQPSEGFVNAFRDGMRERGYVEGQNLAIEYRAPAVTSEQNRDI